MKTGNSSMWAILILAVAMASPVAAQVDVACLTTFTERVVSLYSSDQTCATALAELVADSATDCSTAEINTAATCFEKYADEWTTFSETCPTLGVSAVTPVTAPEVAPTVAPTPEPAVTPTTEPTTAPAPAPTPSASAPEPETNWPSEWEYPAMSPENWGPEASHSEMAYTEEDMEEMSGRRLLAATLSENASSTSSRKMLLGRDQSGIQRELTQVTTCQQLLIDEGIAAYSDLNASPSGANAVHVSVLSVFGASLLGMMLL